MFGIKDRIVELRQSKKMTQEEFAKEFKVAKSTVSMWEKGYRIPRPNLMEEICDYFNVDMDYLTGRSEIPNKHQAGIKYEWEHKENDFHMRPVRLNDLFFKEFKKLIDNSDVDKEQIKSFFKLETDIIDDLYHKRIKIIDMKILMSILDILNTNPFFFLYQTAVFSKDDWLILSNVFEKNFDIQLKDGTKITVDYENNKFKFKIITLNDLYNDSPLNINENHNIHLYYKLKNLENLLNEIPKDSLKDVVFSCIPLIKKLFDLYYIEPESRDYTRGINETTYEYFEKTKNQQMLPYNSNNDSHTSSIPHSISGITKHTHDDVLDMIKSSKKKVKESE